MVSQENDVYSQEQIDAYMKRISFPLELYGQITPEKARANAGVDYLFHLQKYQLSSVPFENLYLHYSKNKTLSLDKDDLFFKIVERNRGGYCMELNYFFMTVLKSLGYDVATTGARVHGSDGSPGGWDHQVLLVFIEEDIYVVDVGFGAKVPTRPLRLIEDTPSKWGSTAASMRLIYQPASRPNLHGLWTLQHRISDGQEWTSNYSFGLTEFSPRDFAVMNYATSTRKTSMFTYKLMCVKMILDEDGNDVIGAVTLNEGTMKRRINVETEVLKECQTEDDRVEVLKDYFGILLDKQEREGVIKTVVELKSS